MRHRTSTAPAAPRGRRRCTPGRTVARTAGSRAGTDASLDAPHGAQRGCALRGIALEGRHSTSGMEAPTRRLPRAIGRRASFGATFPALCGCHATAHRWPRTLCREKSSDVRRKTGWRPESPRARRGHFERGGVSGELGRSDSSAPVPDSPVVAFPTPTAADRVTSRWERSASERPSERPPQSDQCVVRWDPECTRTEPGPDGVSEMLGERRMA